MAESQTKDPPKKDEEKATFLVVQLISESRALLKVSSHVAAGAFHGVEPTKEFTREAAKKRVDAFLRRPAQAPPPKDEEESS